MGIFGLSSAYDADVERATGEGNTSDDWVTIMHVCDRLSADKSKDAAQECLKAILKRMKNTAPHVALQALTLLDACEKNCGRAFKLEIASRMFEDEVRSLLSNARVHGAVRDKLKSLIKQWAHEPEIIASAELKLILDMYKSLAAQGYEFPKTPANNMPADVAAAPSRRSNASSASPAVAVNSDAAALRQREEEEFARAVALSIREAEQNGIDVHDVKKSSSVHYSKSGVTSSANETTSSSLYGNLLRESSPIISANVGGSSKSSTNQVKFNGIPPDYSESGTSSRGVRQSQHLDYKQQDANLDYSKAVEPKRYRVLYDFDAIEADELALKAGEIVLVNDDSDPSWWKGSNPRGEGLFPANFVTDQLDVDIDTLRARELNTKLTLINSGVHDDDDEETAASDKTAGGKGSIFKEAVKIDEAILDRALELIHNADLTGERPDDTSLGAYESRAYDMTPLIDAELEQVDRQHLKLTQLGQRLFESIKLYHETMASQALSPPSVQQSVPYQQQHQSFTQSMHYHQQPMMTPAVVQHQNSYPGSTAGGPSTYWPQPAGASGNQQNMQYPAMYMPNIPNSNVSSSLLAGSDKPMLNQAEQHQLQQQKQPAVYGDGNTDAQWPQEQQSAPRAGVYPGGSYAYWQGPQ